MTKKTSIPKLTPVPTPMHIGNLFRAGYGRGKADAVRSNFSLFKELHIVDLRTEEELALEAKRDFDVKYVPLNDLKFKSTLRNSRSRQDYFEHYCAISQLGDTLAIECSKLLSAGKTIIIGCQLGRDRTGIIVDRILFHSGYGINFRKKVIKDYFHNLSNDTVFIDQIIKERKEPRKLFLFRNSEAFKAQLEYTER